jgi:hypothetical protein
VYSERWSPTLRQGDILGPVLLPLVGKRHEVISTLGGLADESGADPDRMILTAARRYVAVVSHDCEFNEGKRDRLLLARVQEIPRELTEEQQAALRESNDVEARHDVGKNVAGVDSFLLDPLDGHFENPQVVVFTTITPFPMKTADDLHAEKRAELRHEHRLLLRRKLAWFFLRTQDDVAEDEKRPPSEVLDAVARRLGRTT